MIKHLAIFTGSAAEDILSGKKTIETRFSKSKIAPFGVVGAGDIVYIKPAGYDIIGQFRVQKVIYFDGLDFEQLEQIKQEYGEKIAAPKEYWHSKKDSKYGSLIFISGSTRFITSPIKFSKKDQRGWVVLD